MHLSTRKLKSICFVPLTTGVAGTERVVANLVHALHTSGVEVSLVVPSLPSLQRYSEELKGSTIRRATIGRVDGKKSVGANLISAFRVFRWLQPEIVHFHCANYRWGLDVVLAARLAGVPYIVRTEHNPLMAQPSYAVGKLLRIADACVDSFTYVSLGNRARFESSLPYRRARGRVVENGVDPHRFNTTERYRRDHLREMFGLPVDCKLAVYVGSFGDRRSLRPILEAFKILLDEPRAATLAGQWRIIVIGTGPRDEILLPGALGIDGFVTFTGLRSDVANILPSCDLFVTASHYEGMSLAILEAWASGLPVLATRVDGIADVVGEQAFEHFMVPHGDISAFASAWMEQMYGEAKRSQANATASQIVRSNFTLARMIESYRRAYSD